MSNTQFKIHVYNSKDNGKIPCNETRFFYEKVNGKQFHAKFSECDEFSVRLQVRKRPSLSWDSVAYRLACNDWLELFLTKGSSCQDKIGNKLVSSFRIRTSDHRECSKNSPQYKKALAYFKKTGKDKVFSWPKKCLLRNNHV